jgi:ATP-dependent Clp protease ATP-binding subunit ClpC
MLETALILLLLAGVSATGVAFWRRKKRAPGGPPRDPLQAVLRKLGEVSKSISHPQELFQAPSFLRGVQILQQRGTTDDQLLDYCTGRTLQMAIIALEAFGRRPGPSKEIGRLLERLSKVHDWWEYFALRALRARGEGPLIGEVLLRLDTDWLEAPRVQYLRDFVRDRVEAGEEPTFGAGLKLVTPEGIAHVRNLLEKLGDLRPKALMAELETFEGQWVDRALLRTIGEVWDGPPAQDASPVIEHRRMALAVDDAIKRLLQNAPGPVLFVGESGVGKSAAIAAVANQLRGEGWTIFKASPGDLLAGQMYVGSLEQRLRELCGALAGRRVLWVVPEFHALAWAGRHPLEPDRGAFDILRFHFESGALRVLGETQPGAYEQMVRLRPQARTLLHAIHVAPTEDDETLELARQWLTAAEGRCGPLSMSGPSLREALRLVQQYMPGRAAPGNLLTLLDLVLERRCAHGGASDGAVQPGEILAALSHLAGLPVNILDERVILDVEGLRRFFASRILGQPEAVNCLVERVAMIKAGLTDPRRPMGVFLFAGPSGTGKTEIARALSEYLFGSSDRMIRLDMSEFQGPQDLDRILGSGERSLERDALVYAIRRQPFSVVLLDEIEKAHPNVWDLFLQVFDDGRLTDRTGNVADFRNSIVIMTSNIAGKLAFGGRLGFEPEVDRPRERLDQLLEETFRREFLNRIDRVVQFQVLGKSVMREILLREIRQMLQRRGIRSRSWLVEWEDAALDFLIERGFSPQFGARPLKRAIEQYVLAPLALAIAERRAPEGDQFLYVRRGDGRLNVEFVDPDATEPATVRAAASLPCSGSAGLGSVLLEEIALDGLGQAVEIERLRLAHADIALGLRDPEWARRKQEALARMAAPEFWSSPERFGVLGVAEFMDRVEAAHRSMASLLERLAPPGRMRYAPTDLTRQLASQLWLLQVACEGARLGTPRDAFIAVRASRTSEVDLIANNEFADRLGRMYRAWAEKRRMDLRVLSEHTDEDVPYRLVMAVSGFGAYELLRAEAGLHVLESPHEQHRLHRARALVVVAPQPDAPPGRGRHSFRRQALETLRAHTDSRQPVVRWYRQGPAPLVRDRARGWRTGKLDRVMAGDFDLLGACLGGERVAGRVR